MITTLATDEPHRRSGGERGDQPRGIIRPCSPEWILCRKCRLRRCFGRTGTWLQANNSISRVHRLDYRLYLAYIVDRDVWRRIISSIDEVLVHVCGRRTRLSEVALAVYSQVVSDNTLLRGFRAPVNHPKRPAVQELVIVGYAVDAYQRVVSTWWEIVAVSAVPSQVC